MSTPPSGLRRKRVIELLLVTGFLCVLTLLLVGWDSDRLLTALIRQQGNASSWPGLHASPWIQLYNWGPFPGLLMVTVALITLLLSIPLHRLKKRRRQAVFIILAVALGPGLIVNTLLKDHLGRARPNELVEYGGQYAFTQPWQPGPAAPNSSFPSGHAAIAFALLLPWFIWRDSRRSVAAAFLSSGLLFGSLVGLARLLQGGHYLTDVLWSGGIVYLCGGVLALWLLKVPTPPRDP